MRIASLFIFSCLLYGCATVEVTSRADLRPIRPEDPGPASSLYNKGVAYDREGALEKAVACYRAALRSDAFLTDAYYNLGYDLAALGDDSGALDALLFADFLSPGSGDILHNLEVVIFRAVKGRIALGRPAEADSLFTGLRQRFPASRFLRQAGVLLGKAWKITGNPEKAMARFRAASLPDSTGTEGEEGVFWTAEALYGLGTVEDLNRCAALKTTRAPDALSALSAIYMAEADTLRRRFSFASASQMLFLYRKSYETMVLAGHAGRVLGRNGTAFNAAPAALSLCGAESLVVDTLLTSMAGLPDYGPVRRHLMRSELFKACSFIMQGSREWEALQGPFLPDNVSFRVNRAGLEARFVRTLAGAERDLLIDACAEGLSVEDRLQLLDLHREMAALRPPLSSSPFLAPDLLSALEKGYQCAIGLESEQIIFLREELDSLGKELSNGRRK